MRAAAPIVAWIAPETAAQVAPLDVLAELRAERKRLDDLIACGSRLTCGELVARVGAIRHRLLTLERGLTDSTRPIER